MFETCSTMAELSKERQRLIRDGADPMSVNQAYNKAKQRLLSTVPTFRKIPTYTAEAVPPKAFAPFPIMPGKGNINEIIITPQGVLL